MVWKGKCAVNLVDAEESTTYIARGYSCVNFNNEELIYVPHTVKQNFAFQR